MWRGQFDRRDVEWSGATRRARGRSSFNSHAVPFYARHHGPCTDDSGSSETWPWDRPYAVWNRSVFNNNSPVYLLCRLYNATCAYVAYCFLLFVQNECQTIKRRYKLVPVRKCRDDDLKWREIILMVTIKKGTLLFDKLFQCKVTLKM